MFNILVIVLSLIGLNFGQINLGSSQSGDCTTPHGSPGICAPPSTCSFLYGSTDKLRKAECLLSNGNGICCPLKEPDRPRGEKNIIKESTIATFP